MPPSFNGKSSTFHHSTFTDMSRDNQLYYGTQETALNILKSQVAAGAFHNSGERVDPPKCHPETRVAVLGKIRDWYTNKGISVPRIMWLHGPAGSGKSAIAQSVAEECYGFGTLVASFFFSRVASGRNDATRLVATIAYQIAYSISGARPYIQRELENDPMVFSKSLETQFRQLVTRPLSNSVPNTSNSSPKLIIIDGLDECSGREMQGAIVRSFTSMVAHCSFPLRVLILSRPEQAIRDPFSFPDQSRAHISLILNDEYEPDRDIRLFLKESFDVIRKTHALKWYIPETWPKDQDINTLVQKSSGQFIFASTVMQYVKSPRHRPMDRLQDVLRIEHKCNKASPFAELDVLYMHVLQSADKDQCATIRRIFGFLLCTDPYYDRRPSMIEDFLGLSPGDVYLALADYHSIINLPSYPGGAPNTQFSVHFLHASISDFLVDPARSQKFFVDRQLAHAELARACMRGVSSSQPSVRAFSSWNLIRHSESARMNKALLEGLLHVNLSNLFLAHENHNMWVKYSTRQSPWERYRAGLDQIVWIKKMFYGVLFYIPEDLLNRHLLTLDYYLREQILTLAWPHRTAELIALASALQSTPRKRAIVHWNMPIPDAWKFAGILLNLDTVHAYLSSQSMHDFVVCVSFAYQETVEIENLYLKFLHDHERAGEYHIDGGVYARIAVKCIEYICGKSHRDTIDKGPKDDGNGLRPGHDPRACGLGLEILPSLLSFAAPTKELALRMKSVESVFWKKHGNTAQTEYLKRCDGSKGSCGNHRGSLEELEKFKSIAVPV